jgi:hypothetical protein
MKAITPEAQEISLKESVSIILGVLPTIPGEDFLLFWFTSSISNELRTHSIGKSKSKSGVPQKKKHLSKEM